MPKKLFVVMEVVRTSDQTVVGWDNMFVGDAQSREDGVRRAVIHAQHSSHDSSGLIWRPKFEFTIVEDLPLVGYHIVIEIYRGYQAGQMWSTPITGEPFEERCYEVRAEGGKPPNLVAVCNGIEEGGDLRALPRRYEAALNLTLLHQTLENDMELEPHVLFSADQL